MSTIEIMSTGMLEPTLIDVADMTVLLNELNLAAAQGKHFVALIDTTGSPVLLETRNITRARELPLEESFN